MTLTHTSFLTMSGYSPTCVSRPTDFVFLQAVGRQWVRRSPASLTLGVVTRVVARRHGPPIAVVDGRLGGPRDDRFLIERISIARRWRVSGIAQDVLDGLETTFAEDRGPVGLGAIVRPRRSVELLVRVPRAFDGGDPGLTRLEATQLLHRAESLGNSPFAVRVVAAAAAASVELDGRPFDGDCAQLVRLGFTLAAADMVPDRVQGGVRLLYLRPPLAARRGDDLPALARLGFC